MDADGEPPPTPIWDPNKRRAHLMSNQKKIFINNNGEPIKNTNVSEVSSNESDVSEKIEFNYNA